MLPSNPILKNARFLPSISQDDNDDEEMPYKRMLNNLPEKFRMYARQNQHTPAERFPVWSGYDLFKYFPKVFLLTNNHKAMCYYEEKEEEDIEDEEKEEIDEKEYKAFPFYVLDDSSQYILNEPFHRYLLSNKQQLLLINYLLEDVINMGFSLP